ncbi:MAG: phenylalanine 4-monooxygenase [Ilumatobacteraceae bacterium]
MGAIASPVVDPPSSYWTRREEIAALAAGVDAPPAHVEYSDAEHETWATVAATLRPLWEQHAASGVLAGRDRLQLPDERVPQLTEVSDRLQPLTGFEYRAVAGLIPPSEFFAALARRTFTSTQYVRWDGSPLYTPEPDVIHEVMGHANCLACPEIAELHQIAGAAIAGVTDDRHRQFLSDVFWFSAEFGVVREHGVAKAYGAGLLSSPGELAWFGEHAELRPLDVEAMGTLAYDIDHYQPVLFEAQSLQHVLDVVGEFFASATK